MPCSMREVMTQPVPPYFLVDKNSQFGTFHFTVCDYITYIMIKTL
jgi:hypothetical protein